MVSEPVDNRLVAGEDTADGRERLRERPHDQIDLIGDSEMLGGTGTGGSENADGVCFVDLAAVAEPLD